MSEAITCGRAICRENNTARSSPRLQRTDQLQTAAVGGDGIYSRLLGELVTSSCGGRRCEA